MANAKLSSKTVKFIDTALEHMFESVKAHALGPSSVGKRLYIGHDDFLSFKGIAENAGKMEGVQLDKDTLETLSKISSNHLDAIKFKAKAKIISLIEQNFQELNIKSNKDIIKVLNTELPKVWASVSGNVRTVVEAEASKFKNTAFLEGAIQVSASVGIQDPNVFWVVVRDDLCCDECLRLHLLPNMTTPRVWKLSQATNAYHKKGEDFPSLNQVHPNCRCSGPTILLPGWGYDQAGNVTWRSEGWDEFAFQQHMLSLTTKKP